MAVPSGPRVGRPGPRGPARAVPKNRPPRKPPGTPPKGGSPPPKRPRVPPRKPGGKQPPRKPGGGGASGVGFNAQQMAQTLTNLGYDAEIAEIQRAIEDNARQEMLAMSNLRDWSNQIETFRQGAAGSIADVWNQAVSGAQASNENIANLFGESAKGEALAGSAPGVDMLRALGAGDQAFMGYMQPILAQQGMDYMARARGEFADERSDLVSKMGEARTAKSQEYAKNLMDMMQLGWQREQQQFDQRMARLQAQQAQQALNQANKLFGPQLEAANLANEQTRIANRAAQQQMVYDQASFGQDMEMSELQQQQTRQAIRRGNIEIENLLRGGADPMDPQVRFQIAKTAVSGALNKNGVIMMNPRLAWKSTLDILATYGLAQEPDVVEAAWRAFQYSLRFTHSRGAWKKWQIKGNQLVYSPAKRSANKPVRRPETVRGGN